MRVLAISPHLDDAAFSAGGTLAALAADGARVTVATVFTASVPDPQGFALACQLDKGLPAGLDYMALRRAEDTVACARLGAVPFWLDLPEAPHRGYHTAAALFLPPHADEQILPALRIALARAIEAETPDLVLAPQAIGAHVDHVLTVLALQALELGAPVWWWRDFPYVAREDSPAEPFGAVMAALPERHRTLDAAHTAAKRAACLAYASQIGFQFGGEAGLDARLAAQGGVETFRVSARGIWSG